VSDLSGAKVVLLEARMSSELASLVRRHGGEPYCVPALREVARDCEAEVAQFIDTLTGGLSHIVVFQTGVGVIALLGEAEKLGRKDELLAALRQVTTVCRGPKPTAVLARNEIPVWVKAQEPFTTTELLAALEKLEVMGETIAVLHYGERNTALAEALAARGAKLQELCLYEWLLPEDTAALRRLIDEILDGDFTAIAFTSQIQARHLFQLAAETGKEAELRNALNEGIVVTSIGPTCTSALQALGVAPHVEPEHPKMGPMVLALMHYLGQNR